MRRKLLRIALIFVLLFVGCGRQYGELNAEPQGPASSEKVEMPAVIQPSVAGSFYPANADALNTDIAGYLKSANPPKIEGEIIAVIVPHAGYPYSGPIAAYAYKAISEQARDAERKLDSVVVVAFNHRGAAKGVSVYHRGAMETPLGKQPVNETVAREFMASDPRISFVRGAFVGEHSAEVQLPFIQTILPDTPLVPIVFGQQGFEEVEAVSAGLERIARKNRVLVVGTSDLSHYNPYSRANAIDAETVNQILKGNPREMARYVTQHYDRLCGPGPVLAVLSYAESKGAEPVLLKYANSGDTAGSKDSVVGYAAIAFVKKKTPGSGKATDRAPSAPGSRSESDSYSLSDGDKETLLR
ncbi:MAG: AmmeMemoRadiSam system protein B [Candidatus Lindowbacteria bacterium]|nr:AmmeMemoRadiSam system protein B [Candidatus Lindowbacteria bacterium]